MAFWPFVRIVEIAHGLLLRLSAHHASNERHSLKSNGCEVATHVAEDNCFVARRGGEQSEAEANEQPAG